MRCFGYDDSVMHDLAKLFIHFVDGGITDNMGLRAMSDVITVSGGAQAMIDKMQRKIPRRIVVLSVNASTVKHPDMDKTAEQLSTPEQKVKSYFIEVSFEGVTQPHLNCF